MNRFTKLAFVLCIPMTASAFSHATFAATIEERTLARLDALEKENAVLKQRLQRVENSAARSRQALPPPAQPAGLAMRGGASAALDSRAQYNGIPQFHKIPADVGPPSPLRHFEVSGSLLYLQPGSGNLEYATLVTPLPLPTPNWSNQAISPGF